MIDNCRDCKGWKGCSGQLYSDSEGNQEEYYSYREIRWCPYQVFWILKHSEDFDAGYWPKPPRVLECDSRTSKIKTEATFCKPKEIIAEVRARLTSCQDKGRILAEQAINREKVMYLDDDIKAVLYYVSGWRRKATSFRVWRNIKRYRNDNKKEKVPA